MSESLFRARVEPALTLSLATLMAFGMHGAARAQESTTESADTASLRIESVTVTARRREESLQDVPMAISALTSADFAARDVKDMKDISMLSPGLSLNQYGAQRARRDTQNLSMRGVSRGGTGVFVNGAPALGGASTTFSDLERVEVLKGPQSAYFGRSTFAGAVNLVPKAPSSDWKGSLEYTRASSNFSDIRGSIEGPLLGDELTFRLSGRGFSQDGQYVSAFDRSPLTKQETDSASLIVQWSPDELFTARLSSFYSVLHDGVPAYAKLTPVDFNCNAGAAPGNQLNYICGELPRFSERRVGADFPLTPDVYNVLWNNSRGYPNPDNLQPLSSRSGDHSEALHVNLRLDKEFGSGLLQGATASYLGAYNTNASQSITNSIAESVLHRSNSNYGTVPHVLPYPTFLIFSLSETAEQYHEARIASDGAQRWRWMAGISYAESEPKVSVTRGLTSGGAANYNTGNQITLTETLGYFGSLSYDITDKLVVSGEGRYQYDDIKLLRMYPSEQVLQQADDSSFMPRFSLQYKWSPDLTSFVSFARGIQPQSFNASLFPEPQSTLDLVRNQLGAGKIVKGEQIDMYELGLKGLLFDGSVSFDATMYYGDWSDQVIAQMIVVPNANNPALTNILRPNTNAGKTELRGVELSATAILSEHVRASMSYARNETKIESYYCGTCNSNVTGSPNVDGNALPLVPRDSANLFVEYRNDVGNASEYEWYANAQYIFKGRMFTDETNIAWTPDRNTVDVRAGISRGDLTAEAFVTNLFDEYYLESANTGADPTVTGVPAYLNNAFYLGLPVKRQYGVRVRYLF